ncbi:DUF5789 family protein [Halorubrum laminariae]|uniref:DUF2795 domain-containing protein n=1 Tax=Halorubrum laminariae TaxID=1433523 RepID=A0ABD6BZY4_9EURY|nr:hypothetical protein [Halorubrum laminariae]
MVDDHENHARVDGVAFGPLKRALREHRYPVSAAELIEQYGGFELETAAGSTRLETALERADSVQFGAPWEVRDAILAGLADEAVRRAGDSAAGENDATVDDASATGDRDASTEIDASSDWSRLQSEE